MTKSWGNFNYPGHSNGFTLLELLIAVSLSTVLITVLVVGLNLISRDWEKHGEKLDQKIDDSLVLLQLEKAILGTFAYQYKENALARQQLFFEGSPDELLWVSTVSPTRASGLTLWQLKVNEAPGLILKALPVYPGDINKQLEKQNKVNKPVIYLSEYEVKLQYLSENSEKLKQWSSHWSAQDEKKLPLGVRVIFTPSDASENNASAYQGFNVFSFIRLSASKSLGGSSPFDIDRSSPFQKKGSGKNSGSAGGLFK